MTRRLVMGAYSSPHGAGERPRKDRLGELLALAVGLLDFHRYLGAVVRVDPTLARLDTPTLEAFLVFDPAHVRLWELLDGPDSVALRFIARNLPDAYRARQAPALDDHGRPLYEVATIRALLEEWAQRAEEDIEAYTGRPLPVSAPPTLEEAAEARAFTERAEVQAMIEAVAAEERAVMVDEVARRKARAAAIARAGLTDA